MSNRLFKTVQEWQPMTTIESQNKTIFIREEINEYAYSVW